MNSRFLSADAPAAFPIIAAALLSIFAGGAAAVDIAGNFSNAGNPHGAWTYGYTPALGGALTAHASNGATAGGLNYWRTNPNPVPWVAHNPTAAAITEGTRVVGPGMLTLHPGPGGQYSLVRFTAPAAGSYRITGSFFGQDSGPGTSTDVHILRNGAAQFDGAVSGYGAGSAVTFDLTRGMGAGDTIDFAVGTGPGGNNANDSTGLAGSIIPVPVINSSTITNYTGYIIPSDSSDGDPSTNRQRLRTEVAINFPVAGDYRVDWALLDPGDVVVATDSAVVPAGSSGVVTLNGQVIPSSATPLVPGTLYRNKASVVDVPSGLVLATETEAVGRTYIHFTGTVSNSNDLNVVAEVTSVTVGQNWLLDTDPLNNKMPVTVNYKLYRYDDWLGASVNKFIVCNLTQSIKRNIGGVVQPSTATSTGFVSAALASFAAGAPKTPAIITGSTMMMVDPTGHLDSPSSYRFEATISHIDLPPVSMIRTDNTGSSVAAPVDHFNGQLNFGSITTHFSHIASPPTIYFGPNQPPGTMWRQITPDAFSGTVDGRPDAIYGTGQTINIALEVNGVATVLPGNVSVLVNDVAPPAPALTGTVNGVFFQLGSITLNATGAHGTVSAFLPAGVGWTASHATGLLDTVVAFPTTDLAQDLSPIGPSVVATFAQGDFFLCEETKPVLIETTSLSWDIATGAFLCGTATARSIRQPLLDLLASYSADYPDPSMAKKRSNDHLYNFVTTGTAVSVKKGASGGGELTGTIASAAGEFVTHFPYNSTVKWTGTGSIKVAGDLIDVALSSITSAVPLVVDYWQHCQESVEGGCGFPRTSNITFTATSNTLRFTGDGGLQAAGTAAVPGNLSWGWNTASAQYAHEVTTTFSSANFLMAGTFLRGDHNAQSDDEGAAVLLLSGYDAANAAIAERPLTAAYLAGLGDYAGVNFRCTSGGFNGRSHLQGSLYGGYPLTTRSKYYTRRSGVTGIHEAAPSGFPGSALLAGYLFNFDSYGFSFLSNDLEDSLTTGDIDLPAPVNFTLPFTGLQLSCIGALESVNVTGAGAVDSKEFDFWNAPFTPYTIDFAATDACDPGAGTTLVLGFSAHASHFDTAFAGTLGIKPDGNFATAADTDPVTGTIATEVPTRLHLHPSLTVTGTTGETYTFFPAQSAYLNNATGASTGYWSLFGTLDVPFFEDMEVQMHASCAAADTLSPLYFMGGWPAQGWSENNRSPFQVVTFDAAHTGHPNIGTLDSYRKTIDDGTELFLPRVQKLWLGIVNFDYPLKWSNTAFNFLSRGPVENSLLGLITTQHELLFLDADNAEISFGLRNAGLPDISLTNIFFNDVDDTTGAASALLSAAGSDVVDALEGGVDEFDNILSDDAEKFMGRAVDAAIDLPVDGLITVVKNEMADGLWTTSDLQSAIANYLSISSNQLGTALNNLGAPHSNPKSLLADLDLRLAKIEQGIDSVIDTAPNSDPGLLKPVAVGGGVFRRTVFEAVGMALVDAQAPAVSPASIAAQLQDLIAAQDPALATVTAVLTNVKLIVSALRTELQNGTGLGDELRDIIAAANAQVTTVALTVGAQTEALFTAVEAEDTSAAGALDAMGDEWHTAITQMVKDELYATQLTADLQDAAKERLYDLQGAFNAALDTSFASLNRSLRDVLSSVLPDLDNTLDKLTGALGDNIATGSLTGFAHINGDSLDCLRLDAKVELNVPDALTLDAYFQIKELNSDGPESCAGAGVANVEVSIGATDTPFGWVTLGLGPDTRGQFEFKVAFNASALPIAIGGGFEMTNGSLNFQVFKITTLAADCMFSIPFLNGAEAYIAAVAGMEFGNEELAGGVFFGKSCNLDPLILIDPQVASTLPGPTFTGIYAYGEVTLPILGKGTCFFNISAKAAASVFVSVAGPPAFAGSLALSIYGEALCAVNVGAELTLAGAISGNNYAFDGHGRVFGSAGPCKFCIRANFQCDFHYATGSGWDVKY